MIPFMLRRIRGIGWGCVDVLLRLFLLLLPGLLLALLAFILVLFLLLEGKTPALWTHAGL